MSQTLQPISKTNTVQCFHCGETVPKGCDLTATIEGVEEPMCCIGCQAVAQFLTDNNHEVFYQYRQDQLPAEQVSQSNNRWIHLDTPEVLRELTQKHGKNERITTIKIDGMYCSACGWLLQKVLLNLPGISDIRINSVTKNMQVVFDPEQIKLSDIFSRVQTLGYHPLQQNQSSEDGNHERNKQLKRIAVAGFGMMFIMTLAVPLYAPDQFTVAPHIQRFFLMISLLVATIVYFYSGQVFVHNALRDIKNKHLGMDVPVALSISLAYFVSLYLSFKQSGHVYYDSMAMFVFFLLLGRYVESQVRHQGMNVRESLFALVPVSAQRVLPDRNDPETVPLNQVIKGDVLLVNAGEVIPCDGVVIHGTGQVNEAILTGESELIAKQAEDHVYAGAQLVAGELTFTTTANNQESFLAKLADLMELAQSKKPASLQLVDQLASYFVAVVLLLAGGTAIWYGLNQSDALMTALLSVLIATCPCALSLATPTALTAAGVNLLRQGVLVNNTEAITRLAKSDHWFFDKTGTLSTHDLSIKKQHIIHNGIALEPIMAALQQISNHPIASAFKHHQMATITEVHELAGKGVSGLIHSQQWMMGSAHWLQEQGIKLPDLHLDSTLTHVYLACEQEVIAVFELQVPIRAGAKHLLEHLRQQQRALSIISGDQTKTVQHWGHQLGIADCQGDMQAVDKINSIAAEQAAGRACVMVGDGVNDAPVLSQADVSVSLKQGAYLAHSASDMIILGKSLQPLKHAIAVAQNTHRIIKQNLSWSLVYNLSVTPVAMMGLLAPWMAAIGMSLSSLLVVLNSRRLLSKGSHK